jgi:hypothetical protein
MPQIAADQAQAQPESEVTFNARPGAPHGSPAVTFNGEQVIVGRALLWPEAVDH